MAALAEFVELEHLSFAGLPLPATIRLEKPMSDLEIEAFSRRNRPYRVECNCAGELEIMSPLLFDGGQREVFVMAKLFDWAEQHCGVCASADTGFRLPDKAVRCPDASWISRARVDALTREERRHFVPLCPEFLVEVISESDRRAKVEAKMEMWMANGAQLAWMIDPFAATVSIYRPGVAVEVLSRPEWVEADSVVTGFRLQTSRLWAE